jgi:hypothetical protein
VLIWLVVCAAAASQGTVRAQRLDKEAPLDRQPAGWVFTPAFAFGGAWDDNVLLSSQGVPPLEDYGSPLDPNVTLDYRGRKLSLTSAYGGSFVMYRTFEELNSSDQRVRVEVQHRPSERVKIFAREHFIQAPSTDGLNMAGIPFLRIGSRTNEAGGGVEAIVARHMQLTGTYMLRSVSFDERVAVNLEDGYEHDWTLALARAMSPRLVLGGQYQLRREVLLEGADRFNIHSGAATVEYALTPTITVLGLFGIARLSAGLTHDARTGPTVLAELNYRLRDTLLTGRYQQTFVPSFGFGGTFQNEEWSARVHTPLPAISRRLYTEGSVTWYDNEPLEVGQPSLQSLWLSGTLGYRASRWLNVEGYVDRWQQDSQRPGGIVRRNLIGFRVVVSKPMRIR